MSSFSRGLITAEAKPSVPTVHSVPSQFGVGSSLPPAGPSAAPTLGMSTAATGSMFASAPSLVPGLASSYNGVDGLSSNLQSLSQRSHLTQSSEQLKHLTGHSFRPQ